MIRRKQQDTAKGHSKKEWRDTGEKNQTDIQRKGVAGMDEEMVLCAASAYERKFYLNPEFNSLPEEVKQELQIMCVLYTADVGGILMVVYDENGNYTEYKVNLKPYNPVAMINEEYDVEGYNQLMMSGKITLSPIEGLNLSVM